MEYSAEPARRGRTERIALAVIALVAIGWLANGYRAAHLEARGSAALARPHQAAPTRVENASRLFRAARAFNPDTRPMLLEAGGRVFVGPHSVAVKLLRQIVAREPRNVAAWVLLADLQQLSNPAEAARARARVRALSPRVPASR